MRMLQRLAGVSLLLLAWTAPVHAQVLGSGTISAANAACQATNCVQVSFAGVASATVDVINAGTYTLQIEVSADRGTTWRQPGAVDTADYTRDTSIAGAGNWMVANTGYTHLRVRASAYTSGTPVVTIARGFGGVIAPLSAGSVSGANDAAGATGAAVPSSAGYTGVNISGNLVGVTGVAAGSHRLAAMGIFTSAGAQIDSFGGGTQYQTAAAQATPTGTLSLGYDGSNLRHLLTNASGHLNVIFPSAQTVAGGKTNNNAAPGATNVGALIGIANNAAPSWTEGNMVGASFDLTGAMRVTGASGCPTETDDGSIAEGQSGCRTLALNMVKSGSAWVPLTPATTSEAQHDVAFTWANAIGGFGMLRGKDAAATSVTDDRPVAPWGTRAGAAVTQPSFAGTLASTSNGTVGGGVQRVAIASDNSPVAGLGAGATGSAVPANAVYIGGRGSANLRPYTNCDANAHLRMTTATTTELVAAPGSGRVRFCMFQLFAEGTTNVTIVRGTGTNCGTGTTTVAGPFALSATVPGWNLPVGIGEVLDAGADTAAVCITSSGAVGLTILARTTSY